MELISQFDDLQIFMQESDDFEPGAILKVEGTIPLFDGNRTRENHYSAMYSVDGEPLPDPLPEELDSMFHLWLQERRVSLLFCIRKFLRNEPLFTIEGLH
jgi:hypothetical protein